MKKETKATGRGHEYELTELGRKELKGFTKQNAVVMGIIAKAKRITIGGILAVPGLKEKLDTTQEPRRPVAWLLAEARTKHKWIRFAPRVRAAKKTAKAAPTVELPKAA